MSRPSLKRAIFPVFLTLWAIPIFLISGEAVRYFDTAPATHREIRLAVFNPSVATIKTVAALRDRGFLDVPGLVVIGVYHRREATDYAESRRYARDGKLSWFRFHEVSAALAGDSLFRENACTPEYAKIFQGSDGIIFFGGPDIPPAVYGEKANFLTIVTDPFRHFFEASAVFHLLGGSQNPAFRGLLESRPLFPILGICLGCQTLNVGTGGTLIQDIWQEGYGTATFEDAVALGSPQWHTNPHARLHPGENLISCSFHRIVLDEKELLGASLGFSAADRPRVLSSHHQALGTLGRGLKTIATSEDGKIIEAVAHEKYAGVLGVQFHPENPMLWEGEPRFHQIPGDSPFSFKGLLEESPPSWSFHKAIWTWLGSALKSGRTL